VADVVGLEVQIEGSRVSPRLAAGATPTAPQLYEKDLQNMSIAELESHIHTLEASLKDVTPAATDDDSADDALADDSPPQPH
jgi:hypothetical protein